MGSYLSQPETAKHSTDGASTNASLRSKRYGTCEMQGWRVSMEDAQISILDVEAALRSGTSQSSSAGAGPAPPAMLTDWKGCSVFGVYDGHGGAEVAQFVQDFLPGLLTGQPNRTPDGSDIAEALRATYHALDAKLRLPAGRQHLKAIRERSGEAITDNKAQRTAAALKANLSMDLEEAKRKGKLSKPEVIDLMSKVMYIKRLTAQAEAGEGQLPTADAVGCTAITTVVTPTKVIAANAGDSRAVLCRGGKAIGLSEDHKPNLPGELLRIQRAGGTVQAVGTPNRVHHRVNGNLNLSRAIGDLEYKQRSDLPPSKQMICSTPDCVVKDLTPSDEFLVLACDGVWDVMDLQQCVDFVRTRLRANPQRALSGICEELLDACLASDPKATQGIGGDNMTVVIVALQ